MVARFARLRFSRRLGVMPVSVKSKLSVSSNRGRRWGWLNEHRFQLFGLRQSLWPSRKAAGRQFICSVSHSLNNFGRGHCANHKVHLHQQKRHFKYPLAGVADIVLRFSNAVAYAFNPRLQCPDFLSIGRYLSSFGFYHSLDPQGVTSAHGQYDVAHVADISYCQTDDGAQEPEHSNRGPVLRFLRISQTIISRTFPSLSIPCRGVVNSK